MSSGSQRHQDAALYPNAGKQWNSQDDDRLATLVRGGFDVDELAEHFGRSPAALRTRIDQLCDRRWRRRRELAAKRRELRRIPFAKF